MRALMPAAVASALAPGVSWMAMPAAGLPLSSRLEQIGLRAELDARDVAEPHRPIRRDSRAG